MWYPPANEWQTNTKRSNRNRRRKVFAEMNKQNEENRNKAEKKHKSIRKMLCWGMWVRPNEEYHKNINMLIKMGIISQLKLEKKIHILTRLWIIIIIFKAARNVMWLLPDSCRLETICLYFRRSAFAATVSSLNVAQPSMVCCVRENNSIVPLLLYAFNSFCHRCDIQWNLFETILFLLLLCALQHTHIEKEKKTKNWKREIYNEVGIEEKRTRRSMH